MSRKRAIVLLIALVLAILFAIGALMTEGPTRTVFYVLVPLVPVVAIPLSIVLGNSSERRE